MAPQVSAGPMNRVAGPINRKAGPQRCRQEASVAPTETTAEIVEEDTTRIQKVGVVLDLPQSLVEGGGFGRRSPPSEHHTDSNTSV